jgi:CRP/FNR family cyclic AMP-dependent transcriptional regulator
MGKDAWFSRLTPEQRTRFAAAASRRKVAANTMVIRRGSPATELYVVESGKLKVQVTSPNGRGTTFDILGPDDLFGEVGMFGGGERTADVTTMEPSELLLLREAELTQCLREDPGIGLALMSALAERVMTLSDALEGGASGDAGMRLARSIVRLAERFGVAASPENLRVELTLSQQELAELVGVSRVFANTKLVAWQREGMLTHRSGMLTIHDLKALQRVAGLGD